MSTRAVLAPAGARLRRGRRSAAFMRCSAPVGLGADSIVGVCATTDSRPWWVRPASLRAGDFLLLVQEKVTKENDSPAAAPRALPAREVRVRWPVAPTAPPCADGAMSAIHRAPPAGRFGHRPPPLMGTGHSSALPRAKARHHGAAVPARPRWPRCMLVGSPVGRGGGAQGQPAGSARGIAPSLPSVQGCTVGKPRSAPAQSRAPDARVTAARRVPFLLVPFLWASKEKEPARRDAGRTHQGRGSVVAQQSTMAPAQKTTGASHPKTAGRTHQGRASVVAQQSTMAPAQKPTGASRPKTAEQAHQGRESVVAQQSTMAPAQTPNRAQRQQATTAAPAGATAHTP